MRPCAFHYSYDIYQEFLLLLASLALFPLSPCSPRLFAVLNKKAEHTKDIILRQLGRLSVKTRRFASPSREIAFPEDNHKFIIDLRRRQLPEYATFHFTADYGICCPQLTAIRLNFR